MNNHHNNIRTLKVLGCFAALVLAALPAVVKAQQFSVTDIGSLLPETVSTAASAINNAGMVVGSSFVGTGEHAFVYYNGQMTDLGALGGNTSYAAAINDSGQIAGTVIPPGTFDGRAYSYVNGQMTQLLPVGQSQALGINNAGTIVGWVGTRAFSYNSGQWTDIGTLAGNASYAYDINNHGVTVGSSSPGPNVLHAFSHSNGIMTDLGTLGGPSSFAHAINDSGLIVGGSQSSQIVDQRYLYRAFSYSNGQMLDLGALPGHNSSDAYAVNLAGTIVGTSYGPEGPQKAFIYTNGQMIDLNTLIDTSQIRLVSATGINDLGQIVANGADGHSYVLTPIPEPSTYAIAIGLLTLGGVLFHRHCKFAQHHPRGSI